MNLLYSYRWIILVLLLLLLALISPSIKEAAKPNNDIAIWFSPQEPALLAYEQYKEEFGNDRVITLSFYDSTGILQPAALNIIHKLTTEIQKLPGIITVESITNASDFVRISENGVTRVKFVKVLNTDSLLQVSTNKRKQILTSSLLVNKYVNSVGDAALISIRVSSSHSPEILINSFHQVADAHLSTDYYLNGVDVIVKHLNEQSEHDFKVYSGTSYLIMFLIVWFFTRNVSRVLYVVVTSFLTMLFSLGIYGWLGFHLNVFTVMTPPLLIILSIINSLHVMNAYASSDKQTDSVDALKQSIQKILMPFFFALLTTSFGFLSLLSSQAVVLQEFGVFAALGAFFGYSLPIFLGLVILPYVRPNAQSSKSVISGFISACCNSVLQHSRYYTIGIISVIIVSASGLLKLETDMYPIDYFPKDHPVQRTNAFMIEHWGKYFPLELLIEAKEKGQLNSVEAVRRIHNFDETTLTDSSVGTTFSYVTLMQRYCEVAFKSNLTETLKDPFRSKKFVERFVQSMQLDSANLVNEDLTKARYLLTGKSTGNRALSEKLNEIEIIGKNKLGPELKLSLIGYQALFIKAMKYAFNTMQSSLLWSFTLIFAMIWIMLRDFRLALIAILPNLFPILVLLGYMGIRNIDLDLATCTVSAIFLGIAIDDTIHILHRYKHLRKHFSQTEAIKKSYNELGLVFARTSIILVVGFSVLLAANLKTIVYLGELAMVASVSAFVGDLILTPLLLKFFHKA